MIDSCTGSIATLPPFSWQNLREALTPPTSFFEAIVSLIGWRCIGSITTSPT